MGATSVTGVSGPGSVAGLQKGSEHMSLSIKKLIGAHVVCANKVTLSGTTGTVEIPEQADGVAYYTIQLTSSTATVPYISTALAAVSDTDTWTFTITAGSGASVHWAVIRIGL